jgi:N-acetylmuramoyl-L-alanine amidase
LCHLIKKKGDLMNKAIKKLTASILLSAVMISGMGATANAHTAEVCVGYSAGVRAASPELKLPSSRSISSYQSATVKRGSDIMTRDAFIFGGTAYVGLNSFASAVGASVSYDQKSKTAIMTMNGLTLSATDGCFTVYANARPLFSLNGVALMSNGKLYLPIESLAKATGLSVKRSSNTVTLKGRISPLAAADKFYRDDEVLWLSRIIHAESRGEPLLGQIAVGNVVLNRVRSSEYPNTIWGVIFDRKYGVQFSPILDGSIYNTPGYSATLAAKICLEGTDVTGGAFFFLNVRLATSSWIPKNRDYAFTIGNHDFYY